MKDLPDDWLYLIAILVILLGCIAYKIIGL